MRIAITDACIFIDVIELRLTARFFTLDIEIHTSSLVMDELSHDQKEILSEYVSTGRLVINAFTPEYYSEMKTITYPKSLSLADKSVLLFAQKLKAIVLSSDKLVRFYAKNNTIDYHGLIWIIDKLVENGTLLPAAAIKKLQDLLSMNAFYRNRPELVSEIEKRITDFKNKL
jgi:hypothetical protein